MRFRRSAGFGKRIEFSIIAQMIEEGLDIYMPLVDDKGIDVVVRPDGGCYVEVQIKARSKEAKTVAQFSVISHELRQDYWFVFYSEQLKKKWIMNSTEFTKESRETKRGKYAGLR